jgi:hypothetical protein
MRQIGFFTKNNTEHLVANLISQIGLVLNLSRRKGHIQILNWLF